MSNIETIIQQAGTQMLQAKRGLWARLGRLLAEAEGENPKPKRVAEIGAEVTAIAVTLNLGPSDLARAADAVKRERALRMSLADRGRLHTQLADLEGRIATHVAETSAILEKRRGEEGAMRDQHSAAIARLTQMDYAASERDEILGKHAWLFGRRSPEELARLRHLVSAAIPHVAEEGVNVVSVERMLTAPDEREQFLLHLDRGEWELIPAAGQDAEEVANFLQRVREVADFLRDRPAALLVDQGVSLGGALGYWVGDNGELFAPGTSSPSDVDTFHATTLGTAPGQSDKELLRLVERVRAYALGRINAAEPDRNGDSHYFWRKTQRAATERRPFLVLLDLDRSRELNATREQAHAALAAEEQAALVG